ncbi:MAG: arginine--tRNA ligase [Planctomycetia bacterium]|nr:arginine--tRNA ligase [Planctomycetia bacterium]
MNLLTVITSRFKDALEAIGVDSTPYLDLIRPSQDAKFGDYQANFAMPLGKKLGRSPRDVATEVVSHLNYCDLCEEPEIAGPGFINLKIKTSALASLLQRAANDERLQVELTPNPKKFVLDYSAPNVAKPLHVGHIRSTMIGNSLSRVLRFLGHTVISDNHLGDWGAQFGMIIYGYRNFLNEEAYRADAVQELARLYRVTRRLIEYFNAKKSVDALRQAATQAQTTLDAQKTLCAEAKERADAQKTDETKKALKNANKERERLAKLLESVQEKLDGALKLIESVEAEPELFKLAQGRENIERDAQTETSKLHHGDATNLEFWRKIIPVCLKEVDDIYARLDVHFDMALGESFYNDRLGPLVERLKEQGIARQTEGAIGIFLPGFDAPMLIQKSDGGYLYATTDLATLEYRHETFQPDEILYVVDFRQSRHFEQLIAASKLLGLGDIAIKHVKFGTVLGDDGKPFKTRSGDTVGLKSLLDEAETRAAAIVEANNASRSSTVKFTAEESAEIARRVGIGALVYADLSQNRESDYVFSYDKMLAMNGNTATYMQYAYARVRSIFAKGSVDVATLRSEFASGARSLELTEPEERALAFELLKFQGALESVTRDYRPNLLTAYLYDLANKYSAFFEKCPVLKAEEEIKAKRLLLCDLTARTIAKGLELLGIQTVERM